MDTSTAQASERLYKGSCKRDVIYPLLTVFFARFLMSGPGKRILLVISGGIAAYKVLEVIRRLKERQISIASILTESGAQFVTPLSVSSLTGEKVYQNLFDLTDEAEMGHIQLSRDADLLVVAPATADLLAKMASGLAGDLATTALLATDKPVLVAPAMNVRMWQHPATQRNLSQLAQDGVQFVGPNDGDMACGEFGPGRMAEPDEIVIAVEAALEQGADDAKIEQKPLLGKRVLVTAGPTREPIDPVRYIANRSSGKQGYAIADALAQLGARVILVSGPVSLKPPAGVELLKVETADEMLQACSQSLPADIAVCTAAVADWRAKTSHDQKLKKSSEPQSELTLVENPDILKTLSTLKKDRPSLVIGFAAETTDLLQNAKAKRDRKGCDWIVANDVSPQTGIMGGDHNQVHLISENGIDTWPSMSKKDVAEKLAWRIAAHFNPQIDLPTGHTKDKGHRLG